MRIMGDGEGESEFLSSRKGRGKGNVVGGSGGVMAVSEFSEGGDVYLLSLMDHLHVKKAPFLCGQN